MLFVDRKPVGIIEAKKEEEGFHLITVEEQSSEYAASKLKYLENDPLPFVFKSTGVLTRFTDHRDPKPRSRPIFSFFRPDTFREWMRQETSFRRRIKSLPVLPDAILMYGIQEIVSTEVVIFMLTCMLPGTESH
jgi:type I restriction enzyme, R subunit